jgi:uncharacterized protein (TIGR02391 family)
MSKVLEEKIMGEIVETKESKEETKPVILDQELLRISRRITNNPNNNDRVIDNALTVLEDRIRNVAGLNKSDFGQRLIDKTFRPGDGVLIISDVGNEPEGYWKLFDGFFKALKNPLSHRRIPYVKNEAIQIIQFADYLISLLEKAKQRNPI